MKTTTSTRTLRRTAAGLAAGAVALLGVLPIGVAEAVPAPQRMQTPGPTPVPHLAIEGSQGCSGAGTGTVTCNLFARAGYVAVDDSGDPDLPVWVFDDVNSGDVELLNPVIEMVEGDTLAINLTNVDVPANVSLSMPVVPGVPDSTGIATGSTSYSFGPLDAGTYLYQAGPTPTGARQIAMGMAGAVVVRPAVFTTDGTAPTVSLTTTDNGGGAFTVNVAVTDANSGVALLQWFETDPAGTPAALPLTGGPISGLVDGADITVRAVDTAGNETILDALVDGVAPTPSIVETTIIVSDQYTDSHRLEASRGETEFLDEILAVTNEFDPGLNGDPLGYDIAQYAPTIFTINGQSHDGDVPLPEMQAGTQLLVRSVNAGLQQRRIGFADARLTQFTAGSRFLAEAADLAAVTLPPGGVADAKAVMPLDTPVNVALFDHGLSTFKNDSPAVAGQVQVWTLPGVGDPTGPKVTNLQFDFLGMGFFGPNDTFDGSFPALFEADITYGAGERSWRYFVDDLTAPVASPMVFDHTSNPLHVWSGFDVDDQGLANGEHVLWVQAANDPDGAAFPDDPIWGPVTGLVFEVDRSGPVIRSLAVTPNVVNNDAVITLTGTADTTLTGPGSDVQVVKYIVDSGPVTVPDLENPAVGTTIDMPCDALLLTDCFDGDNPTRASFTGDISTAGLTEGVHTIRIYAKDSYSTICCGIVPGSDHWSQVPGEITFNIDLTAPLVDSASIDPNPNDGTMAHPGSQIFLPAVKLEATLSDGEVGAPGASGIVEAEFWLDDGINPAPAEGDAGPLGSTTARWGDVVDGAGEACDPGDTCHYVQNVYADIPLADIRSLPAGDHTFYVRGRDAAGNWSDAVPIVFTLTAPAPELVLTQPVADEVHFDAVATDGVMQVVEWWYTGDPIPAIGLGTLVYSAASNPDPDPAAVSGDITGLTVGDAISVRAVDTAGGVIVVETTVLDITAPIVMIGPGPENAGEVTFDVTDPLASSGIVTVEWYTTTPGDGADATIDLGIDGTQAGYTGLIISDLPLDTAITIRVTDGAGNFGEAAATSGADTTPPLVTPGPGPEDAGEVTFDVADDLPSSGIASVIWYITAPGDGADVTGDLGIDGTQPAYTALVIQGLTPGTAIMFDVTDGAGNTTTATATAGP